MPKKSKTKKWRKVIESEYCTYLITNTLALIIFLSGIVFIKYFIYNTIEKNIFSFLYQNVKAYNHRYNKTSFIFIQRLAFQFSPLSNTRWKPQSHFDLP